MTPAQVAEMIRAERLGLCELLRSCSPEAWLTPSLCDGWAIRDVVAHLVLATTETWQSFLVGMVKYRGNFDRLVSKQASNHAAQHTPAELIDQLERAADSTRRSPGSAPIDPLLDLLVHGQDIACPLGIEHRVPPTQGWSPSPMPSALDGTAHRSDSPISPSPQPTPSGPTVPAQTSAAPSPRSF